MKSVIFLCIVLFLLNGCYLYDCGNIAGSPNVPLKVYKVPDDFLNQQYDFNTKVIDILDSSYIKYTFLNPVDSAYRILTSYNSYKFVSGAELNYVFRFKGKTDRWISIGFNNYYSKSVNLRLSLIKSIILTEQYSNNEWESKKTKIDFRKSMEIQYKLETVGSDSIRIKYNLGYFHYKCNLTKEEIDETIKEFEKDILPFLNLKVENDFN